MTAAARPGRSPAGRRLRVAGQRDERVADGGEHDPGNRAVDRRYRLRQHWIAEIAGTEQLLDRHAERPGQAEGDPQARFRMAGLYGGRGLPGDAGHARQLLLRQAASLPGVAAAPPSGWEISVMSRLPFLGLPDPYPQARRASTRSVTGWLARATASRPDSSSHRKIISGGA